MVRYYHLLLRAEPGSTGRSYLWFTDNRTPNAGGEDLIEEGITGHLVPIRSPENC